jgi:hypothetical protein
MKTFLVKNLIVVFALLLGIGTMSFKSFHNKQSDEYWFSVDGNGQVTGYIGPELTGDCSILNNEILCAQSYKEEDTFLEGDGTRTLITSPSNWQQQAFRDE